MELIPAIPFVCSENPVKMEQEYREQLVKYYTELYLDEPKVRKPEPPTVTYNDLRCWSFWRLENPSGLQPRQSEFRNPQQQISRS